MLSIIFMITTISLGQLIGQLSSYSWQTNLQSEYKWHLASKEIPLKSYTNTREILNGLICPSLLLGNIVQTDTPVYKYTLFLFRQLLFRLFYWTKWVFVVLHKLTTNEFNWKINDLSVYWCPSNEFFVSYKSSIWQPAFHWSISLRKVKYSFWQNY